MAAKISKRISISSAQQMTTTERECLRRVIVNRNHIPVDMHSPADDAKVKPADLGKQKLDKVIT